MVWQSFEGSLGTAWVWDKRRVRQQLPEHMGLGLFHFHKRKWVFTDPGWGGQWGLALLGHSPSSALCHHQVVLVLGGQPFPFRCNPPAPAQSRPGSSGGQQGGAPQPCSASLWAHSLGMGKCLAGWRCAGSCAVTHLAAPTTALDVGPWPPAIPARGDIEFSVCFASVIGQDAVKGGESAQGRGVKEIGKHY